MRGMSPNLSESLVDLWDTVIPKLQQYLEGNEVYYVWVSVYILSGSLRTVLYRGLYVLSLMRGMSPNLSESLVDLWDTVIPKLQQYLEGNILYYIRVSMYYPWCGECHPTSAWTWWTCGIQLFPNCSSIWKVTYRIISAIHSILDERNVTQPQQEPGRLMGYSHSQAAAVSRR